jgi:hypothetical protein
MVTVTWILVSLPTKDRPREGPTYDDRFSSLTRCRTFEDMTHQQPTPPDDVRATVSAHATGDTAVAMRSATFTSIEFWMALGLILLSAIDLAATRVGLSRGAHEANPILAPFIHGGGVAIAKTTGVGLVALNLLRKAPASRVTLRNVLVLYGAVVVWNAITVARYW